MYMWTCGSGPDNMGNPQNPYQPTTTKPLIGPRGKAFLRETGHQACSSADDPHGMLGVNCHSFTSLKHFRSVQVTVCVPNPGSHHDTFTPFCFTSFLNGWCVCLPILQDLADSLC